MVEEKIINYNGVDYIISSDGHVYSTHNSQRSIYHQEISQRENSDGYMIITTGITGSRRTVRVHRLVAMAFIPNPNNYPEVNHKDCNRKNNDVSNLEWCTHEYNIQYSIDAGNHICTTDLSGANNPNFGNHKLSEIYSKHPELAKEKNSRSGSQNGRARPIQLYDITTDIVLNFDYIRIASKYLIDNGYVRAKDINAVSDKLSKCANNDGIYYKRFKVKFCD